MLYSLRSELLVIRMDVSRCILVLDTSISATSNLGQREYRGSPHAQQNYYAPSNTSSISFQRHRRTAVISLKKKNGIGQVQVNSK